VRGWRRQHDGLHRERHALDRCVGAGQHLQGHHHQNHEQCELRHGARDGGEQDAERGGREQVQRGGQQEQRHRAGDRHGQRSVHDNRERGRRHRQHHQPIGPDLGGHDLERSERHDQKMFERAVLALADQRRAGQDDG